MFLLGTNIFLEILLGQDKEQECIDFISNNIGALIISDFSVFSIGIILFENTLSKVFKDFTEDILSVIKVSSLPLENYDELIRIHNKASLDFDDCYHVALAKTFDLKVVTMDKNFKKVQNEVGTLFV